MKRIIRDLLSNSPLGPRLMVLVYALGFPLALVGHYTHAFNVYEWLGLSPVLVWKGQLWRPLTYGLIAGAPVEWAVNLFWLVTLVSVMGRNWSSMEFWVYCLVGILGGALPILIFKSQMSTAVVGSMAMVFALLVAWDWFYHRERLLLLGFGEISGRQAAVLIGVIDSVILFFCAGWFYTLAMWCGGVAGWLYLTARSKLFLGRTAQQIRSERVARLEL